MGDPWLRHLIPETYPVTGVLHVATEALGLKHARLHTDGFGSYLLTLAGTDVSDLAVIKERLWPYILSSDQLGAANTDVGQRSADKKSASRVVEHALAPRLWVFLLSTSSTNLADLAGLPIEGLIVEDCDIKSLDPIVGMPLKYLRINNAPVTHFPNLRGESAKLNLSTKQESFPPLRFVDLANTRIADISGLEGLPVEFVNLTGTAVSSLEPLRRAELMWISFWGTDVRDTSPLAGMTVYTHPEYSGGEAWRNGDEKRAFIGIRARARELGQMWRNERGGPGVSPANCYEPN